MTILPDNIVRRMSPADRKSTGQMTAQEADEKCDLRLERELQKLVRLELCRRGWWFDQSPQGRKSRGVIGKPDFIICAPRGTFAFIECKTPDGRVSPEQAREMAKLTGCGAIGEIARSFQEAKLFLDSLADL